MSSREEIKKAMLAALTENHPNATREVWLGAAVNFGLTDPKTAKEAGCEQVTEESTTEEILDALAEQWTDEVWRHMKSVVDGGVLE